MTDKEKLIKCLKLFGYERVFSVTKLIAESDSIGECYSYCPDYNEKRFCEEIKNIINGVYTDANYLESIALDICLFFD